MINKNLHIELKPFLRWWANQLAFLIPTRIRTFFYIPKSAIILRFIDEKLTVSHEIHGEETVLMTISPDISNMEAVKNLLNEARFKNAIYILRLSSEDALNKVLNLPLAAKNTIEQVVSYELDRYSPFTAAQVYFATRLDRIDTEIAQLVVQLMLVPRKQLETRYQNCKNLGITPHFADIENCPTNLQQLHTAYNLLPAHLQPQVTNQSRFITIGLLSLLLLSGLSCLILPIWLASQGIDDLQNQLSKIEKDVKAVKALQADMESIREEHLALITEKTASPPVVTILNEIAMLMKDDSWLSYLQYSEGQLQLQGESPTASNLLADLEASDYFAKASFASPVTQDKASGMERFQISAEITKPDIPENSDATTDSTENTDNESPESETVENATIEEVVTEDGTPEEQSE